MILVYLELFWILLHGIMLTYSKLCWILLDCAALDCIILANVELFWIIMDSAQ